ncbi:endo-1,3-beta-xylanase [Deinococcus roseus]|uniref:GH26 domain-containing protein n=1 Tax=Deinococcus roseus TaxID=392414 RepID=A0ABQ2D9X8_9DEIO|nr:endo-1,3-beta-xylanase [Deinococcus roseus]GGJ47134.1 hypothetical protein GCM10008938_36510 [Deinococcus roseus]
MTRTQKPLLLSVVLLTSMLSCAQKTPVSPTFSGKFLPENGKIQFILGQDSDTLSDARKDLIDGAGFPAPAGITLYTNIGNTVPDNEQWRVLGGVPHNEKHEYGQGYASNSINLGSGKVDFKASVDQYSTSDTLSVGLWLSGTSVNCAQQPLRAMLDRNDGDLTPELKGQYRYYFEQLGQYFKSLTGKKVFLRIGYEFDGPWNCFNAQLYRDAFKEIKKTINAQTDNVAYVWQASAWPQPYDQGGEFGDPDGVPYGWYRDLRYNGSKDFHHPLSPTDEKFGQAMLDSFYPGDDVVDWVGVSYFYGTSWMETWGEGSKYALYTPTQAQNAILKFARAHNKPVQISESAPQGYDLTHKTVKTIFNGTQKDLSDQQIWDGWYVPYFKFISDNKDVIRSVAYINTFWQSQASWICSDGATAGGPACPSGYWGDHRLQQNAFIRDHFQAELQSGSWLLGK